jgi:uncharacterized membrane protein
MTVRGRGCAWGLGGFVVLLVAAPFLIALGITFFNPEKTFSLPRVDVDAVLQPDGSMDVVEHITYDFTGKFSFGTRPIPVGSSTITDIRVSEDGETVRSEGGPYNLKWFFSAEDEERTFDISYRVENLAQVGTDVAEVYWKWVGEEHPKIGDVTVTLVVPAVEGVRAWGHGELTGRVEIDGDVVGWYAPDVPAGSFVEGRVAIPSSAMSVPPTSGDRLPTILTQEEALADAANAARIAAAADARAAAEDRDNAQALAIVATVVGIVAFLLIWLRWGREPRRPTDVSEYVRDLPDDPPAVVHGIMNWGRLPAAAAFSTTLLDLAQRGYLTITEDKQERKFLPDTIDYTFVRTGKDYEGLAGFERQVLDLVFAEGDSSTEEQVQEWARAHQATAASKWASFQSDAQDEIDQRKYIVRGRFLPYALNVLVALVIGVIGFGALALEAWWAGALALAWAVVQLGLTITLRRRTVEGARRFAEWEGVRNYLRDFSELETAPAGHLVLWERYLVYSVALGVSDELARAMAVRLPEAESAQFATWYAGTSGISRFGTLAGFSTHFGSTTTASFTPPSSSSGGGSFSSGGGGGGGFSGGGGGGGGGGGIGAG